MKCSYSFCEDEAVWTCPIGHGSFCETDKPLHLYDMDLDAALGYLKGKEE